MLDMARVVPSDTVYDLGSGDGRIVVEAVRRYGAKAVGIEADPLRLTFSRFAILIFGVRMRAKIVWSNFFHEDLANATVVTVFLTQGTNQKLKAKLRSELRKGARVVSYSWSFDGWTPDRVDAHSKVYLYVMGHGTPDDNCEGSSPGLPPFAA
jgi:hypothetical protein